MRLGLGESATGLPLRSKLPFISTLEPLAEVVLLQVRSIVGVGNDGLGVGIGVGFSWLVVGDRNGVGVADGIMGLKRLLWLSVLFGCLLLIRNVRLRSRLEL